MSARRTKRDVGRGGTRLVVMAIALDVAALAGVGATSTGHAWAAPPKAAVTYVHADDEADARIGTYVSSDEGFRTNSYWIEGDKGVVVIDTQFLLSAAEELIALAERSTGKKVTLAIVLHPNPDKFNGAAVFNRRGIRVITSSQVLARLPAVHELRKTWFYDDYKPDYPADLPKLESFGDKTQVLKVDGLALKLHVLGKGCSDAHVVVEYAGHLFPGDVVTNDYHAWLELGYLDEWSEQLRHLQTLDVKAVHPGRGPSGDAGLLRQQQAYLETVVRLVREARPSGRPNEKKLEALQNKIVSAFPGHRYPLFVSNGLEEVWKRQQASRSQAAAPKPRAEK
ncbi:MAG TPA: MBL fold metallo-hydrolase [Polyangia bacterium]